MTGKNQSKTDKILFYTHSPRAFRTTLIGYLYEISQIYPTILLSEKLDSDTEKALADKSLFPKLEKIISVKQITGEKRDLFFKNRYLYNLARDTVKEYKPDIVISASDVHSLFELYLFRFAKKVRALNICVQPTSSIETKRSALHIDLVNAYLRFPVFLPLWFRLFGEKLRKFLGHFLYYWILPLMVGEKPFFGKSSYILRKGNSGMRDADYQIVFSKRDYDIYFKDGVPAEKLYILPHPLARETRKFFEKVYFEKLKINQEDKKIVSVMLPGEIMIGFKRKNYSLISIKERKEVWIESLRLISRILSKWKIYIKPHPDTPNFNKIKGILESISNNIEVVDPKEPADKYIEIADVIISLPLSMSTTVFTASLQCPEKVILSLDLLREFMGDFYKGYDNIEFIDDIKKLEETLILIRDNKYQKKYDKKEESIDPKEFFNIIEVINFLKNGSH